METSTKQDKLLFFGITFATLAALAFIINFVNPIAGIGFEHLIVISGLLAILITALKFGFGTITEKYKSINGYLISGIIWSALATMKWVKYAKNDNLDWIMAALFTFVAVINWVNYFRKDNK